MLCYCVCINSVFPLVENKFTKFYTQQTLLRKELTFLLFVVILTSEMKWYSLWIQIIVQTVGLSGKCLFIGQVKRDMVGELGKGTTLGWIQPGEDNGSQSLWLFV